MSSIWPYRSALRYVTLRRVQEGWKAKGLLRPYWLTYDGGRDALARAVGTSPTVLSSINSGRRNLGFDLGPRLAAELDISLVELGGPDDGSARSRTTLDRLATLEAQAARQARTIRDLTKRLTTAEALLGELRLRPDTQRRAKGDR